MTPEEKIEFNKMREQLSAFEASDRYTIQKLLQMFDGRNIQLGRTTGTKIGLSSSEKLGLWGQVPVDQPETVADATGTLANAVTTINAVISRLKEVGSIK